MITVRENNVLISGFSTCKQCHVVIAFVSHKISLSHP